MSVQPSALLLSFEVLGEIQIRRRLEGLQGNLSDLSPALEKIADSFEDHMDQVFETGGMATAGHWPNLSKAYKRWKDRHYPGKPILTLEGKLRASMASQGAVGHVREVDKDSLRVGSELRTPGGRWYLASLHQEGTDRMPRRRIINLPEHLKQRWMRILREHVTTEA